MSAVSHCSRVARAMSSAYGGGACARLHASTKPPVVLLLLALLTMADLAQPTSAGAGGDAGSQQRLVVHTRQQTTTSFTGRDGLSCSTISGHTTCIGGSGRGGGGISGRDSTKDGDVGKSGGHDGTGVAAGQHASTTVRSSGLSCSSDDGGRIKCLDAAGNEVPGVPLSSIADASACGAILNNMAYDCPLQGASGNDEQGGTGGPEAMGSSANRARTAGAAGVAAAATLFPPCFPFCD